MTCRLAPVLALSSLFLVSCDVSFSIGNNSSASRENEPAAPATRRFVNSMQHARSEPLRRYYVDFSFDYPANWAMTAQPTDGSAQNYVRVAAPLVDGYEPFAFHVGHAWGTGDAAEDRRSMEASLPAFAQRFGANFQNYRVESIGVDNVGDQESMTWRFTATGPAVRGGAPAQIYGRGDVLLPPGATRGVILIALATSRTDEVRSAADVGESGTLGAIYDSFRLQPGSAGAK